MLRCPNCKEKVVKFPIKDSEGKLIVKNLFKMDIMSIILVIVIITMVVTYKVDTKTCREILTNPLVYCVDSNACKIIEERENIDQYEIAIDIEKFNTDG